MKVAWLEKAQTDHWGKPLGWQKPGRLIRPNICGGGNTDPPERHWVCTFPGPLHDHYSLANIWACILSCLVSFVSKRLESIKLQVVVTRGCEESQLRPGDNQTDLRAAGDNFRSSTRGYNNRCPNLAGSSYRRRTRRPSVPLKIEEQHRRQEGFVTSKAH